MCYVYIYILLQGADTFEVHIINKCHCRTERDVSAWSQEVLNELLLRVRVENKDGVCQITDVRKIEGEASINNRKGKLIFFYEWTIKASWTGMFTLFLSGEQV